MTVGGEVDVGTEGPPQQALQRIMCERGARLLLDVSGASFMDCAGLRAPLAAQRHPRCGAGSCG